MSFEKKIMTRRSALRQSACGFGGLALARLCADSVHAANPLAKQKTTCASTGEADYFPVHAGRTQSCRHIRL